MKVEILKEKMKWSDSELREAKKGDIVDIADFLAEAWIKCGNCRKTLPKKKTSK